MLLPLILPTIFYISHILLHSFILACTSSIPITPTDTENYFPSDDPKITSLMVSHYCCGKQHNIRLFNLLNVKQSTEAPSNIQHAYVKARVYVRAKLNVLLSKLNVRAYKCVAYAKLKERFVFKVLLNIDVLIELNGFII